MTKATLLVIQGVDQGARFEIDADAVDIGRGIRNQIRILDTEVSRRHASIQYDRGVYVLSDQASSNGTFVNGAPVRSRALADGDQIQCGRSILVFNLSESGEESKSVAERVDLQSEANAADQARIVGELRQDPSRTIIGRLPETAPSEWVVAEANLQALYRISEEAVSPSISLDQLLRRILELTIDAVGADRGCILLSDPESGKIVPQVYSDQQERRGEPKMPVSRSIVDYVLEQGQGVRTSDARKDRRFLPGQSILQAGIREAMCVPMQGKSELMGVVYVDTTIPPERALLDGPGRHMFSDDQLRLLVAIGRQTSIAVENNRYQQALVKAERLAAMGQTIAMLSHHIKNILQGIRGGSYLIDMGLGNHDEEIMRKGWGIVEKNQNKIYHLVMDMLTFSKERQPVQEIADLNETVADVCELMQSRAGECEVGFRFDLSAELPTTTFDRDGIHRAVLNVVTNAIDASEGIEGGEVCVRTGFDSEADSLFVEVIDNGPGIVEEQIERIFNVFESTKGTRGTGLGLAVSRKIVREHGGDISVESQPNAGCRFTLSWPRIEEEQMSPENGTKRSIDGTKLFDHREFEP